MVHWVVINWKPIVWVLSGTICGGFIVFVVCTLIVAKWFNAAAKAFWKAF